jgi:hypothetical protein
MPADLWQATPPLVIVDDFDIVAMALTPDKTDSPLIIDPNRVLPFPIASQCFQLGHARAVRELHPTSRSSVRAIPPQCRPSVVRAILW